MTAETDRRLYGDYWGGKDSRAISPAIKSSRAVKNHCITAGTKNKTNNTNRDPLQQEHWRFINVPVSISVYHAGAVTFYGCYCCCCQCSVIWR